MLTPLEKYFAQRVKNLFNSLHDFEVNGDEKSMHDLRVEMKKLRVIIKFLRSIYPKEKLKKPAHLLRLIFHEAGEIREFQLMLKWIAENQLYSIEKEYYPPEKFQLMISEFIRRTEKHKSDFSEIIDHVSKYVHDIKEIFAEQYFAALNARCEKQCRKSLPKTRWHELRKIIKQRMYAYNWVHHEPGNDDPNFSYYHKLQEAIGFWHDLVIIKESLSQKEVYLSQNIEVQKDFNVAWNKLNNTLKQREKQIEELLSRQLVQE